MEGLDHSKRFDRFTSSQAYRLCKSLKNGEPTASFYSYVKEVKIAKYLGRRTKTSVNTKATKWGKLMEIVLFDKVGLNYAIDHVNTILHPKYGKFWSGTPDFKAIDKTAEIKCFEPLHFGNLVMALETKNLETIKSEEPEVFWQTISNSILSSFEKSEIIAFMPYKSELIEIFKMIEETNFLEKNNLNPGDYLYFNTENIEDFPYLPDDSKMKNINTFEFIIPEEDKELLTSRMLLAEKLLNTKT